MPGQVLDSYAGDYALAPGVVIHIERQGDQLLGVSPTGQRTALDPETNTEFVVHDTTDVLYFTSDEHGQVKGAVLNNGGQEVSAARIRKQP